jgi:hypothetical protein
VGSAGAAGRDAGAPAAGLDGAPGGEGSCRVYFLCAQPDKNRTVTSSARTFLMLGFDYAMSWRLRY